MYLINEFEKWCFASNLIQMGLRMNDRRNAIFLIFSNRQFVFPIVYRVYGLGLFVYSMFPFLYFIGLSYILETIKCSYLWKSWVGNCIFWIFQRKSNRFFYGIDKMSKHTYMTYEYAFRFACVRFMILN